jgi:hypothetical protein
MGKTKLTFTIFSTHHITYIIIFCYVVIKLIRFTEVVFKILFLD